MLSGVEKSEKICGGNACPRRGLAYLIKLLMEEPGDLAAFGLKVVAETLTPDLHQVKPAVIPAVTLCETGFVGQLPSQFVVQERQPEKFVLVFFRRIFLEGPPGSLPRQHAGGFINGELLRPLRLDLP